MEVSDLTIQPIPWPYYSCTVVAWLLAGFLLGRILPRRAAVAVTSGKKAGTTQQTKRKTGGRRGGSAELYVGNLAEGVGEKEVQKRFERFGKVLSVRMIVDRDSGAAKGYGFVRMQEADEARTAAGKLNNEKINGQQIVVSEARTRARRRR
jgi:hypothetical protein